jgi:outer membrane protein insertion porin family
LANLLEKADTSVGLLKSLIEPMKSSFTSHPGALLFLMLCFLLASSFCADAQEKVQLKEVRIQGNLRVEEDGIRLHVKSRAGESFDPTTVDQDVKSIYRMGFFDDVMAELSPEGVLTYAVKEKPYVREVKIVGNSELSREKIEASFGVTPRTVLDRDKVSEGVEKVKKLYTDQGYVNAQIEYATSMVENNQAVVSLTIDEGKRLLIQKISFEGNKAFSDSELKGLIATKEKWFLSFITNRGVLDQDILTNDVAILSAHYYDHGFVDHKIDEPVVLRRRDGIEMVIRVDEGEQYRVGKVELGGDLIEDADKLLKKVQLTQGQIFNGGRLRGDITNLSDMYSNKGFAFVQVDPRTKVNAQDKTVDVALVISQGPPVYFNRVMIAGNTKTRDKVIRRELTTVEQELFSGNRIKESRNALQRTGFFEDVQLTTKKTDQPDAVDLSVDIKEGPTGSFSIGAGYSSGDQVFFVTSIGDKNLFGRGQSINANFDIGTVRQDFILSFTEPYFYDTPLSLGLDAFNAERDFNDYKQRRTGFGVRTSYPLKYLDVPFFRRSENGSASDALGLADDRPTSWINYTKGGMAYELTREKISDVDASAPASIQGEKGSSWTSSLTPSLSYDSRDHFFNSTEGILSGVSTKYAGLGGDNNFLKSDVKARWYYPLLKDPNWGGNYVLGLGGTVGYGVSLKERPNGKKELPLFERYFPGGINSVRGFADRSLGPREGNDPVGGDKQAVLNVELLFPIMEQYGLRGVTFFDMGQAFKRSESFNFASFRRSIGIGARWLSPFGPLRVELGFPINKESGDDTSIFGFSLGAQP